MDANTTAIILAVIASIGSSGALVAAINWWKGRHRDTAETDEIYERLRRAALQDAEDRALKQDARIRLYEYKVDEFADLFDAMLDDYDVLALTPAQQAKVRERRARLRELKRLEAIPENPPPAPPPATP